jgi:predicted transcriptional regulator
MNTATDNGKTAALIGMAAKVAAAYVSRHQVPHGELAGLISSVHGTLAALASGEPEKPPGNTVPAVSIKKSVTDAYIVCLEDGKRLKMLKRYLRSHFDMSPEQYRAKWGLAHDYPMVAPDYAKRRSDFAKSIGLGRTGDNPKRGRKKAK